MTTGFQISEVSENTTSEVKIGGLTLADTGNKVYKVIKENIICIEGNKGWK